MKRNWIEKLRPLINAGWELRDGKLQPSKTSLATDLNWIFSNVDFDCTLWNKIYHEIVTKETRIHSHCHDCIKIVAKPTTLKQLVKIERIQDEMLYPCKCGIDVRPHTTAIYGAYWYNRGFPEARHRYKILREIFDKRGLKKVGLIIKRGCTEFELRLGPSNLWPRPSEDQLEEEKELLDQLRWRPQPPSNIPDSVEHQTHVRWVEWAYQNGDMTYLEFTGGIPLHEPLVTYDPEGEDEPRA